ncbi:MAG TPA: iron ABC transporter permease [Hyphomicrobiaceae bacterium]|nr:iron ABC transporter permease [Hyphomicrobiaceae bacterium]
MSDAAIPTSVGRAASRPRRSFDWTMLVWIAFAILLAVIVINPILRLVWESVATESGGITFDHYLGAYGRWRYIQSLLNTLVMGLGTATLATLIGVPLAWACVRTDMPGRGFIKLCVLAAFIIPPYLAAVGWVLLAGPNAGWLNRGWMWLTGAKTGIFNIYSVWGLIVVMGLHLFFFIFVFTSSALELVSSEMEDAANILGAGPVKTAFRVTLPLIMPAILGGFIIIFLQSIALFGVPAIIAIPARYPVVTTQLQEFFSSNNRVDLAAAYAIPLLLITMGMLGLQRWFLGRRGFTVVGGKGGERRVVRLGRWRWVMFAFALFVATLAVFMPLLVLLQAAFAKAWGAGLSLDNLTLDHVRFILFKHETAVWSLLRSIIYAGAAAFSALTLALVIGYVVKRGLMRFGNVLAFLCMAPFVIPGIILAIGFYAAYAPPPLMLAGTSLIIIVAFTTRLLPIAYQNASAGIAAIHVEMEEAVRILGGNRLTAIRRVVAPLLSRSLIGAWILIFVPACQELSTAIFLSGPGNRVLSVLIYDFSEEGRFEQLAVLGGLLLIVTVAIVAIGFRIVGRDFMIRRQ